MNTRQQGAIGVAQAISYFTEKGYVVLIPVSEVQRYDLVVEKDGVLSKIEVKTTGFILKGRYNVHLKTCGGNQKTTYISAAECDFVLVRCDDGTLYLFPVDIVAGKGTMSLGPKWDGYKI